MSSPAIELSFLVWTNLSGNELSYEFFWNMLSDYHSKLIQLSRTSHNKITLGLG